jgi:hypothetical protein
MLDNRKPGSIPRSRRMGFSQGDRRKLWPSRQNPGTLWSESSFLRGRVPQNDIPQDRQLYVFDPAALYSILVKDQDLYEEPPTIIRYLIILPL